MTNFLEGLVLRAAGLPPSAAAAPRRAPAGESLEPKATLEEIIENRPEAPQRRFDVPPERERVVMRESPTAETPHAPERIVEVRQTPAPAPVVVRERLVEPARSVEEQFHEEDIRTEREVLITPPPSAPLLVPPPVTQIESSPRQAFPTMSPVHREEPSPAPVAEPPPSLASPAADEGETRETPQPAPATVVVQPIVLDRTRTIVEPVREERVVETERQVLVPPQPPSPLPRATSPQREEAPEQRADVSPRLPLFEPEDTQPAPERDLPRAIDDERSTPQTLVLPQVAPNSAAAPLLSSPTPPAPPVSVRIGTIEIRAAAPPPPPPAPAPPAAPTPEPDFRSGFDDYVRIRRYTPEAW